MEGLVINDFLPYDEQHTLEAILRHHGKGQDTALAKDLATFGNWIHLVEQARFNRSLQLPLPLVLLSTMGIYGSEALSPREESTPTWRIPEIADLTDSQSAALRLEAQTGLVMIAEMEAEDEVLPAGGD